MKKVILGITLVVFGIILAAYSTPARAASRENLPQKDAVVLKQTLDVLGVVLGQLDDKIANSGQVAPVSAAEIAEINARLETISGNLRTIHGTLAALDSGANAIVEAAPENFAETAIVQNQPPLGAGLANGGQIETAVPPLATQAASAKVNAGVAVIGSHLSLRQIIWPAIAVIVAFGAVLSLRSRKRGPKELGAEDLFPPRLASENIPYLD